MMGIYQEIRHLNYPHMAGNEPAPVPGYSSVFSFYSRVQYALPGERLEAL